MLRINYKLARKKISQEWKMKNLAKTIVKFKHLKNLRSIQIKKWLNQSLYLILKSRPHMFSNKVLVAHLKIHQINFKLLLKCRPYTLQVHQNWSTIQLKQVSLKVIQVKSRFKLTSKTKKTTLQHHQLLSPLCLNKMRSLPLLKSKKTLGNKKKKKDWKILRINDD